MLPTFAPVPSIVRAVIVCFIFRLFAMRAGFLLLDNYSLSIGIFLAAMVTIGKTIRPVILPSQVALSATLFKTLAHFNSS
jgi:hypothetical protein